MSTFSKKFVSAALSLATAVSLSGGLLTVPVANAQTTADLQAQIATLLAQIQALQTQLNTAQGGSVSTASTFKFTRDLTVGSKGDDVKALQQFLNANGFAVASSGAGSPGKETTTFGPATKAALAKFQAAKGVKPSVGYFGPKSRAAAAAVTSTTGGTTPPPSTGGTTPPSSTGGTTGGTTTPPPPAPTTGQVTVSLAANSPGAGNGAIPGGAFYAPTMFLDIANGTDKDVKITGLTVHRIGVLSDSDILGVLVTDDQGILHGNLVTFGQSFAFPGFNTDPVIVKANTHGMVRLNVNLRSTVSTGTLGMQIDKAADIQATDSSGNAVTLGGKFPLSGNVLNIVTGSGSLGQIQLSTRTIVGGDVNSPIEVDQGQSDVDVAKFRFQEISGNEDVELCNVELQNNGSASQGDYFNMRLVDQNNTVVSQTSAVTNNIAKFALKGTGTNAGPNGCYLIPNGQLRDFVLLVDTATNTNSAGRTVNFTLQNDFRVRAIGLETNAGVNVVADAGQTFPIGDNDDSGKNFVKFRAGSTSLSRSTASLSGKIAKGATNLPIASVDVRAFGEDIELQELGFLVLNQNGNPLGVGKRTLVGTIKVQNASGGTIFSLTANDGRLYGGGSTGATINGNTIGTAATNTASTQFTLSSFYSIPVNTTGKLVFVGDINQNATAADSYKVRITSLKFRKMSSNTFTTIGSTAAGSNQAEGNGLTVEDSNLIVTKSTSFNPVNLVLGGSVQKIASFNIQAGAAEDVQINAMQLKIASKNGGTIALGSDFTAAATSDNLANLSAITLKDANGTPLSPSQNLTSTGGATYSTQFAIPKNTTKSVDIWAVISTAFGQTTAVDRLAASLTVTSVTASQSQTTFSVGEVLGQQITTKSGGTLAFSDLGSGQINIAKVLHASEADVPAFEFKVRETANAEDITLSKLYLGIKNPVNTVSTYKLLDEASGAQLGVAAPSNNGEVRFTGLNFLIAKGGEKNFVVKISTPDGATIPATNTDVKMGVTFTEFTGATSGITTRETGGVALAYGAVSTDLTSLLATTTRVYVNDIANFEVGDIVFVDLNNNMSFTDQNEKGSGTDGMAVKTVTADSTSQSGIGSNGYIELSVTSSTSGAAAVLGGATNGLVVGGRISKYDFTSRNHTVQEVEPIITAFNVGLGSQVAENEIGTFKIEDQGGRSLKVNKLRFEVSGSFASGTRFAPKNFKLDLADTVSGTRTFNLSDTGGGTLNSPTLISYIGPATSTVPTATTTANTAINDLSVAVSNNTNISVNDRIAIGADNNGGIGYRVTASASTSLTVTPGISSVVTAGAAITKIAANPTIGATAVVEGGQTIEFNLVAGLGAGVEIAGGSAKGFVLLADTTRIKDNSQQGTIATTQVRILGSRANPNDSQNGLTWSYIRTADNNSSGDLTVSDSYIVSGKSILYQ